jgi:hypothetical protein
MDGSIADHYPCFVDKVVTELDHYSMLVMVAPGGELS